MRRRNAGTSGRFGYAPRRGGERDGSADGEDAGAVVDQWLRSVGVSGLRVVDASVMPTTVAGNAQAAVLAIAERAADFIRAGH